MNITQLRSKIEAERSEVVQHSLFSSIDDMAALRIYMQHHVYAVWDFMSLLKSLQRNLTCVQLPWVPVGSADTRFLINEIVTGEESDVDREGNRISHFELYLRAMEEAGADTRSIHTFIDSIIAGESISSALRIAGAPEAAASFVSNTFRIIESGDNHVLAAVFTFGREDLIPDMFLQMLNKLSKAVSGDISTLKYYIERHIEVDGDHHSLLACQMTENLCGDSSQKWMEAEAEVIHSLRARVQLWDGALREIRAKKGMKEIAI